jgi:hypothetical protein
MSEQWREIQGYEGVYEVSDLGNVRRVKPASGTRPGSRLKPLPDSCGQYFMVSLSNHAVMKRFLVHALVAVAFLGKRPRGRQVNHKDGDKRNNAASNLEYVTRRENMAHAYRLGLVGKQDNRGERNNSAKLTVDQVLQIRSLRGRCSSPEVARRFSISRSQAHKVLCGQAWPHVTAG